MTREEAADLIRNCGFNVESTIHDELERVVLEALRQERPKGRYIPDNRYQTLGNCSLCNGDVTMLDNFCPCCGADMRGEEE